MGMIRSPHLRWALGRCFEPRPSRREVATGPRSTGRCWGETTSADIQFWWQTHHICKCIYIYICCIYIYIYVVYIYYIIYIYICVCVCVLYKCLIIYILRDWQGIAQHGAHSWTSGIRPLNIFELCRSIFKRPVTRTSRREVVRASVQRSRPWPERLRRPGPNWQRWAARSCAGLPRRSGQQYHWHRETNLPEDSNKRSQGATCDWSLHQVDPGWTNLQANLWCQG